MCAACTIDPSQGGEPGSGGSPRGEIEHTEGIIPDQLVRTRICAKEGANKNILLVYLNNLYKFSLKSVHPCFCYGHINNVKPDLDLEQGYYGLGSRSL